MLKNIRLQKFPIGDIAVNRTYQSHYSIPKLNNIDIQVVGSSFLNILKWHTI